MTSFVFFGSGPVAAQSLRLLSKDFRIEAVITKPNTVDEMQEAGGSATVHTASSKIELDKLFEQQKFSSSVGVLVDFGIIVSRKVIDYFPKGIVNSHFSLLPELRGADPISFAILEGKKITGVSLMLLVEAMDEGPLLAQSQIDLDEKETTPSLTERLIDLSYAMLITILPLWLTDKTETAEQAVATIGGKKPSYTRKLTKTDGTIDWRKPAVEIEREVRAYQGWPKSRTVFSNLDCIVNKASVIDVLGTPGELFVYDKELGVYCGNQALLIHSLKPAGKKDMTSQAFLAGYKDRIGL